MKTTRLITLALTLAATAVAEDKPVPQARVRLDPDTRTVSKSAPKFDPTVGPSPAFMMERVEVKGESLLRRGPPSEPEPVKGPFTLVKGGSFIQRDLGPVRVDVKSAPYTDILWKDARFKPIALQIGNSFLNFSW